MKPVIYILPVAIGQTGFVELNEDDRLLTEALYYWLLANPKITKKTDVGIVDNETEYAIYLGDEDPENVVIKVLGAFPDIKNKDQMQVYQADLLTELRKIGENEKLLVLNPHFFGDWNWIGLGDPTDSHCQLNLHNLSEVGKAIELFFVDDEG